MTGFEHAAFKDLDDRVRTLEAKMTEFVAQATESLKSIGEFLDIMAGKDAFQSPQVQIHPDTLPPDRSPVDRCTLCGHQRKDHLGALLSCPTSDAPENQVFQEEAEDGE